LNGESGKPKWMRWRTFERKGKTDEAGAALREARRINPKR
jgi:hypothetical protein